MLFSLLSVTVRVFFCFTDEKMRGRGEYKEVESAKSGDCFGRMDKMGQSKGEDGKREVGKQIPEQSLSPEVLPRGQREAEESLLLPCRRCSRLCISNSGSIQRDWINP